MTKIQTFIHQLRQWIFSPWSHSGNIGVKHSEIMSSMILWKHIAAQAGEPLLQLDLAEVFKNNPYEGWINYYSTRIIHMKDGATGVSPTLQGLSVPIQHHRLHSCSLKDAWETLMTKIALFSQMQLSSHPSRGHFSSWWLFLQYLSQSLTED